MAAESGLPSSSSRVWPLRGVLTASLLLFAVLPAINAGWAVHRSNLRFVEALAHKAIADGARRVQADTQAFVLKAYTIINGKPPETPNPQQARGAQD